MNTKTILGVILAVVIVAGMHQIVLATEMPTGSEPISATPSPSATPTATPEATVAPVAPCQSPEVVDPTPSPIVEEDWSKNGARCVKERAEAMKHGWYLESCDPLRVWTIQEAQERGLL